MLKRLLEMELPLVWVLLSLLTTKSVLSATVNITQLEEIEIIDLNIICENANLEVANAKCEEQLRIICANGSLLFTMLDASGKFPFAGLGYATKWDYGNFDQCMSIDHTYEGGRILGEHCATGLVFPDFLSNLTNTDTWFRLGICRPNACNATDLIQLASNITGIFPSIFQDGMCETMETNRELTSQDLFTAVFVSVCVFFMITSTMYDFYLNKKQLKCKRPLYLAFSVLSNGRKLLHVERTPKAGQIETFNGFRVISMAWIIAGHGIIGYPAVAVSNDNDVQEWENQRYAFYITAAPLAVDTFFFMSGFLLAYLYLKQKAKPFSAHVRSVPVMYLHRYLRLTPALFACYMTSITLFRLLGRGPLWTFYTQQMINSCKQYWWTTFLYIQNYYNYDDICLTPLWYISADMQMFLLSPLVIIPIALHLQKSWGFKLSMAELAVINLSFIALPMTLKLLFPDYDNEYDTHSRLINYYIGFMLAVFMRVKHDKPFLYFVSGQRLSLVNLITWIVIILGMLATVICYQEVEITHGHTGRSVFQSLMRPAWCIGLSWIVYSSYHGYGGFVNWILTRPIFQVVGRLTYCMYLMHGLVLVYYICTIRTQTYFNDYNAFYFFCGHYVMSLLVALFWTLAFESPFLTIEKLMFENGAKRTEEKAPREENGVEAVRHGVINGVEAVRNDVINGVEAVRNDVS